MEECKNSISYNNLWELLIDKNIKRKDLKEQAEVSQDIMVRLSKNQPVTMDTLEKICAVLDCNIGDVVEFIHVPSDNTQEEEK